jgi:hypothetical protein
MQRKQTSLLAEGAKCRAQEEQSNFARRTPGERSDDDFGAIANAVLRRVPYFEMIIVDTNLISRASMNRLGYSSSVADFDDDVWRVNMTRLPANQFWKGQLGADVQAKDRIVLEQSLFAAIMIRQNSRPRNSLSFYTKRVR